MPAPASVPLTAAMRAVASQLGAATVYEAAGQRGALPSRIAPIDASMTVCGPAFPVTCPPGDNLRIHQAIYAAAAGEVLVVETGGADEHGYFGEVLARAAMIRGIAGLVTDGGVRDATRMTALGFGVFAANRCIRGTSKRPHGLGQVGGPAVIGGVVVSRGDLVVGDGDGVVVIPAERSALVLAAGQAREAAEAAAFARLEAGESTLGIYGLPSGPAGAMAGRISHRSRPGSPATSGRAAAGIAVSRLRASRRRSRRRRDRRPRRRDRS